MLKAIIVDDEPESIKALEIKLSFCDVPVDVVTTISDSRQLLPLLRQEKIDILFLDIEMPGLNGFDLLEEIDHRDFEVILVTAFSKYAIQGIKASAKDYLLKPVDLEELQCALHKVQQRKALQLANPEVMNRILELSSLLKSPQTMPFKLALSSTTETHYVAVTEIVHITGENNYSTFYLNCGKEIVVSRTLKEFEDLLVPHHFLRIHKSHIINLNYIQKLKKGLELSVLMSNEAVIEISYRKKAEFLKVMKESSLMQ